MSFDAPQDFTPTHPVADAPAEAWAGAGLADAGLAPAAAAPAPVAAAAPVAVADPAVDARRLHLLRDVELGISVELGRSRMTVSEVLGLAPGMVVELDRTAGSPVDVLVNGTLMARGEVVVVDEEFAVRITEVVGGESLVGTGA